MLDDLKIIHTRDKSDALGVASKQWQQLSCEYGVTYTTKEPILNVVLAGMGGSAWPALYLNSWPTLNVPLEVVENYAIPRYVGKQTLFIASSYSGNTEETLAALDQAEKRGAQIVVICAGGKLAEHAEAAGHILYSIPTGIQPRMSTFYFLAAFMQLLEPLGLIPEGSGKELSGVSSWLSEQVKQWEVTIPVKDNLPKQLAQEMIGKSVVIYAGPLLGPVAKKWKICINENAKHVAWWNQFPAISHNEFIGWTEQPQDKPYCVVNLQSSRDNVRVAKRFEVTEKMLSGRKPAGHGVDAKGETDLQQLLWTSMLGDFTSIYLAVLNNVDPTPVGLVEEFKKRLDD